MDPLFVMVVSVIVTLVSEYCSVRLDRKIVTPNKAVDTLACAHHHSGLAVITRWKTNSVPEIASKLHHRLTNFWNW